MMAPLSTRPFDGQTLFFEMIDHPDHVIALNFNDPLLDRATGTTHGFERFAHLCQSSLIQGQPFDQGHPFAFSTLGLPGNPDDAIAVRR